MEKQSTDEYMKRDERTVHIRIDEDFFMVTNSM